MELMTIDSSLLIGLGAFAIVGYRRALLREFLTAIGSIIYATFLAYYLNKAFQNETAVSNAFTIMTLAGSVYIVYLIFTWVLCKALKAKSINDDIIVTFSSKITAAFLSMFKACYIFTLVLLLISLHIPDNKIFESSKIVTNVQPAIKKIQKTLMKNGIINNEVVIYRYKSNEPSVEETLGIPENPLLKHIKSTDKYKQMQEKINKQNINNQVNQYLDRF